MDNLPIYLNKAQIRRIFEISEPKSKQLFDWAMKIDKEELGEYLLFDYKVRSKTVLRILNGKIKKPSVYRSTQGKQD